MSDLTTFVELFAAVATFLLALFTALGYRESVRIRTAQFDINLDLFVASNASKFANLPGLYFHMVNYGPGVAKDIKVEYVSKVVHVRPFLIPYLAPMKPSEPLYLQIDTQDKDEFQFDVRYSDLLERRWFMEGKLAKNDGVWEFTRVVIRRI